MRQLADVVDDLTSSATTEADFRNGTLSVLNQVNDTDIAINMTTRNIALTGDVTGTMSYQLGNAGVSIETTIGDNRIDGSDIEANSINNSHLISNTITTDKISNDATPLTGTRVRFIVYASNGVDVLFELDGLRPTTV